MKKVPEMMRDVTPVAPVIDPSEAQKYVRQR
jgi:hypothetical protein